MLDLIFLALTIAVFMAAIAYLAFCDGLKKGETKQ